MPDEIHAHSCALEPKWPVWTTHFWWEWMTLGVFPPTSYWWSASAHFFFYQTSPIINKCLHGTINSVRFNKFPSSSHPELLLVLSHSSLPSPLQFMCLHAHSVSSPLQVSSFPPALCSLCVSHKFCLLCDAGWLLLSCFVLFLLYCWKPVLLPLGSLHRLICQGHVLAVSRRCIIFLWVSSTQSFSWRSGSSFVTVYWGMPVEFFFCTPQFSHRESTCWVWQAPCLGK